MEVMREGKKSDRPYKTLGARLKHLREKVQETQAEVAGAVEIEVTSLERYEQGHNRPSEDILLLLTSHFDIKENEAVQLWKLAGYERADSLKIAEVEHEEENAPLPSLVVMPFDTRIIYSDKVQLTATEHGVVIHFAQTGGSSNQAVVVSRIGMSKEYARSVLEQLQKGLEVSEPKALPAPKTAKRTVRNKNSTRNKKSTEKQQKPDN